MALNNGETVANQAKRTSRKVFMFNKDIRGILMRVFS